MRTLFAARGLVRTHYDHEELGRLLTVNGKVAQRRAGCPLDLNIGALKQEEDGFERVAVDLTDICRYS